MFEFLGKFMGISLRTRATLPFHLPAIIYKAFSGEEAWAWLMLHTHIPFFTFSPV